jgi:hypothetical protein
MLPTKAISQMPSGNDMLSSTPSSIPSIQPSLLAETTTAPSSGAAALQQGNLHNIQVGAVVSVLLCLVTLL